MEALLNINPRRKTPIYLQIVHSINQAILKGKLTKGDQVQSINELSEGLYLGRETVQKAYNILRRDGVLVAVPGKGFYVNRTDLYAPFRILLLFNKLSNYKTQIYNGFTQTIGEKALFDLKIHQSDPRIFQRQLLEKHDEYDYYVILPHFKKEDPSIKPLLESIPPNKLILLDRHLPDFTAPCAAVYQDFRRDIDDALEQALDLLKKYREIILVPAYPLTAAPDMTLGVHDFCRNHGFRYKTLPAIDEHTPVAAGQAYIVVDDTHLAALARSCEQQHRIPGRDVGILSYNDTPLKEILFGGITVISTDHTDMGRTAARMILGSPWQKIKNPFTLIRRNSL